MAIQERLGSSLCRESVWDEFHLDQEINDRGVALDMALSKMQLKQMNAHVLSY